MKRFVWLIFLFFTASIADINQTIVNETNATFYKNLLKELNTSSPDYTLQKTLIYKITQTLSQDIEPIKPKEFAIKSDDDFVDLFFKITSTLAQAKAKQDEIEDIKEQIEDIEEDLEQNATLTQELELAYYKHLSRQDKKFVTYVNANYKKWLDALLLELPRIKFDTNVDKSLKIAKKKIEYINKRIKKLRIELERWKILEDQKRIEKIQKDITALLQKRERYVKKYIKAKLKLFFAALKAKDQKALEIAKEIVDFAKRYSITPHLPQALQTTLAYTMQKELGSWKTYLLNLKQEMFNFLNNNSVIGIPLYKFAQALGIFLLFLFLRKLFALIVLKTLNKMASLTKSTADDKLIQILEGPTKFGFVILGFYFALKVAGIDNEISAKIIKSLVIILIFWLLYNAVHILDEAIYKFARKFGKELYREIGAFFIKTLKIFIFAIGLVSILQEWDINVSAFIASLGLGGLAFALAAKDTAANLFGGLSILADRALKMDDWIKVNDIEGTVEEIGLRTTKIRTFEKSLVTVPNQIIANNPIENFSRRNIRRIKMRIGLVYSTTQEQIEAIVKDIRNMLQSHPGIAKRATLLVNFDQFGSSELSVFIYCFTNTADWAKYLEIREDVNLKIMQIVQKHGSDFAFPSESIYIEKLPEKI